MATVTLPSQARSRHAAETRQAAHEEPGPWLFLAAPLSFAATLVVLIWLSIGSFH